MNEYFRDATSIQRR